MDVSRSKVVVLVMVFFPARMVVMMTVIVAVLVVVVCTKQPSACEIRQNKFPASQVAKPSHVSMLKQQDMPWAWESLHDAQLER